MVFDFNIRESDRIRGVWIIKPNISHDIRGKIWTSFEKDKIEQLLPPGLHFKHDKFSMSVNNVLRGIHGDSKSWKLVTCVYGDIMQVVVDLRKKSATYLEYEQFNIKRDNHVMILIPPNMGNAYYVNSSEAVYHYKLAYEGEYLDAEDQFSVHWNDQRINIHWPTTNPLLSDRDK